jgi:hypothetical protein
LIVKSTAGMGIKGFGSNELTVIPLLLLGEYGLIPYAAGQDLFGVNVRCLSILPVMVSAKEGT